jgi:hypothetical protein
MLSLLKLNLYAKTAQRMALLAEADRVKAKDKLEKKRMPITKVLYINIYIYIYCFHLI